MPVPTRPHHRAAGSDTAAGGRWRRAGLATATGAVLLALAACGGDSAAEDDTDAGPEETSGAGFPVTIESTLGEAVIPEAPQQVVALGQGSADTAVALGIVPVGIEEYAWGSDDTGYLPWLHDAVLEAGEELPVQFAGTPELDVDAIAELAPDVILAPQSGLTQQEFDLLSELAPVVAYPGEAWSTPWDEQIEIIGIALGEQEEAAELVNDINATLAETAAANPEFIEHTFAYLYTGEPGVLGVFQSGEPRVDILTGLGLQLDPVVDEQPEAAGTNSAVVGLENADLFRDTDLIFTFYSSPANRAEIEAQPLYAQIPAVERGSLVVSADQSFVTASSLITPLTVPYVLDTYVTMIDAALENVS